MFVSCDSKDYFYFNRRASRQRLAAEDKTRVSLPSENMIKPLGRAVRDRGMLLEIRCTGQMDRQPDSSGQAIKADRVASGCQGIAGGK